MITEDYVSFETAKLLKKKGFEGVCSKFYMPDGNIRWKYGHYHDFDIRERIECPTFQMAMKWLRENFNINPVPYALPFGWAFDVFDLSNRDITDCKKLFSMDLPSKLECYNSYEEVCEAAIKYCVKNLI